MSKIATSLHEPGVIPHGPTPEEIDRQLRAILASPVFHGSRRCQQFLEYVCGKSLEGEGRTIKERMIAIDVFGRSPHTDLGEDTIVRVGAREVRKRLAQYYVTAEGAAAEIRIELPSGSYAPEFRYVAVAQQEAPPPAPAVVIGTRTKWWNRTLVWAGAFAALAAVATVAVAKLTGPSPNAQAFRLFWQPIIQSDDPLLVAVAHPIVYHPSSRAIHLSEQGLPPRDVQTQRAIEVAPEKLTGSDFVPVYNQYVGFGDMVAANEVIAMLARKSKPVNVRMASSLGFADLRKAQVLLIGAVTNRWTMELQQTWRFRFRTPGTRTVIVDTQESAQAPDSGAQRQWSILASDDGSSPDDYVLVGRIRNSYTGGLVLEAAGLKQFGTEAAGRLLTDSEQLGALLRKLPPGWEGKNVQLVLHVRVIGNTPAQPEVLASYVW